MSEELVRKSRATAWAISIVAMLALYLLTLPPAVWFLFPNDRVVDGDWRDSYQKPYLWLEDNTPLGYPLRAYERWLMRIIGL